MLTIIFLVNALGQLTANENVIISTLPQANPS